MQVQIPGYHIKKVLGKGGMATVYLAVQEIFEREVALKVMSPALAEDPSFGQRFLREARIVSHLVHPNIITVFDVGVHENCYFLSMEYIPGPDLKHACAGLTLLQKLAVIEDVARALEFAGAKGYVHRDIKPENILLRSASGGAVLMDFGIARASEADLSVTQTGTSLGTPHYMSPEQAKGQGVDLRSDLYSLGVVLYYLLMEAVPYPGDSAVAIGVKHITEPVPVLPPYLQLLNPCLAKLMAKQPQQRYQQAAELLADLQRLDHKKLLKQYALKSRYSPPVTPSTVIAQATLIHQAPTRLSQSIYWEEPLAAPRRSWADWARQKHRLVAAVAVLAAAVAVAGFIATDDLPAERGSADVVAGQLGSDASPVSSSSPRQQVFDQQPAGNNGLADRLSDGLAGLTQRLGRQQIALTEQVSQLREQLSAGDPGVQQELDRLADQQLRALEKLLAEGELAEAHAQLRTLKQLFPEHPGRLQKLEQRLHSSDLLDVYARKAQERMARGQYLDPEDDSAEHYYFAMLEIDPTLAAAHNGLVDMAKRAIVGAEQALSAGDWKAAQYVVDRLLALDPDHRASLTLQKKIDRYRGNEATLVQHLDRAAGHLAAGNLYSPQGENAYTYYQKVLQLQKQHRAALQGLEQVHEAFAERVYAMVERGEYREALEALAEVRQVRGADRRFKLLSTDVQKLVEQRQAQQLPVIEQVVLAAEPLERVAEQRGGPLPIDDTLYVGLRYHSFAESGALVQAVVYGPGGLAQANVPVNIVQAQGTHFFSIERARKSFADGTHQLKLVMDGKTLARVDFDVK